MKKIFLPSILLLGILLMTQSCTRDECTREVTYFQQDPVYLTYDQIRVPIETQTPRSLNTPGKIYVYGDYLFINELQEGIHVIDNSDPSTPNPISFIAIPGSEDMAVQNGILYANNYTDLIALDITEPTNVTFKNRVEDAFPSIWEDDEGTMLVGYKQRKITEVISCDQWRGGGIWGRATTFASFDASLSNQSTTGGGSGSGTGGSMARFTISKGHLYIVDNNDLHIYDVNTPTEPTKVKDMPIGWGIETIFPYQDKLFIGSSTGMFIYDNETPTNPTQLSSFAHVRACDPVFVKDNYAYVTLRSGTWCQGFTNQLDLIDITDLRNPVLEQTFEMDNPHGLSISDNSLFLCEGEKGMKVFDIETPEDLNKNKVDHLKDFHAYDVITLQDKSVAIVIGEDGLYQYDYSNPSKLSELSKIEVKN